MKWRSEIGTRPSDPVMKGNPQDPARSSARLADRFAVLLGDEERRSEPMAVEAIEFAARLATEWSSLAGTPSAPIPKAQQVARLAAWVDGLAITPGRAEEGSSAPVALGEALASLDFIERIAAHSGRAPTGVVEAAIGAWRRSQGSAGAGVTVVPLRRDGSKVAAPGAVPMADTFLLLAAADGSRDSAVVCRSESGLWTLEVFVEEPGDGGPPRHGYLLLSVHPDHRTTYEERNARIYVVVDDAERVLLDAPVRGGEVYAPISLVGLDLWRRDAINVVFNP